ncbi:transcriptional antiterminator NusG [Sediminibacillus halophilus]|uniref:Transcription termination/antitermination protein NusG n=2 Tax=Sediminibacillus TaxID=482460 RepID=A0A1G9YX55_9BACI|nr:transcriptional antiterminator NusG [Sediminibacillus halophilus]
MNCGFFKLAKIISIRKGREGQGDCPEIMEKNWYVVHTYSGYENKVKTNLEKRLESMGMEDKIFRVLVPEDEETEIKNGKKKVAKKKVFPGYVLAEMIMTDDSWYVVRNTPGVTGFVGSTGAGSKPIPLLPEEAEFILKRMGMQEQVTEVDFEEKESVRVTDGPFTNFTGTIEQIDLDKQKVKVHVNMFGRETPVELEFSQIEKL